MRTHALLVSITLVAVALTGAGLLRAQQTTKPHSTMPECPLMQSDAMTHMNERGAKAMGFSQVTTTHHFYLTKTGGIIKIEANDPKDTNGRDQIRQHFRHIVMMFAEGNFDIPMFVHGQVPPGVAEMRQLRTAIDYKYEKTNQGGRVEISSADPKAVAAVQEFLRFQITEHKTGDPLN